MKKKSLHTLCRTTGIKKIKYITDLILQGLKNRELYDREEIDSDSKNVTAMKFFKGQENDRIYCKEQRNLEGVYIIVTSVLYEKKNQISLQRI
ncbi:MAG: hypothetical protein IPP38_12350 [Bacteroidetes bacterium]|nr:hypothetical protein [Bacteroidota bacterium]